MSENEEIENKPVEKPVLIKIEEAVPISKPQEQPTEIKQAELRESFANKAGDQGVFFNPVVGTNTPDPFAPQDAPPSSQTPPVQTIVPPTPPVQPTIPTPPVSSGEISDSGE